MSVKFKESLLPLLHPLDEVKPWPDNPRTGDIEALKESIKTNGFYSVLVVQKSTGYVVAGNHRMRALEELGESQAPMVFADMSDEEAVRLALADNRTSDLALYDEHQLFELLDSLAHTGDGLVGTGYDRAAYELLMQTYENEGRLVGGVRQGVQPEERLDAYNDLDVRSLILPYQTSDYEVVASGLIALRDSMGLDTNAEVVHRLVTQALAAQAALDEVDAG